jgi:hypothetical protein
LVGKSINLSSKEQINVSTRNVERLESFEDCLSVQTDILNFILDVNGVNSQRRANIAITDPASARQAETLERRQNTETAKKALDLFAEFSNITIHPFNLATNQYVGEGLQNSNNRNFGIPNLNAMNNFISSFIAGPLRSPEVDFNYSTNAINNQNKIVSYSATDFVRRLSTNIRLPIYFDYSRVPNQLRTIMIKPKEMLQNIRENIDYSSFSKTAKNKAINYFYFEMLTEVEYLDDFQVKDPTNNTPYINTPIWKTLNESVITKVIDQNKELLCRLKSFSNHQFGVTPNKQVEKNYYDKFFIIKFGNRLQTGRQIAIPSVLNRDVVASGASLLGPITDRLRETFQNIDFELSVVANIGISAVPVRLTGTQNDLIKSVQDIKIGNFMDLAKSDVTKKVNVRVGNITPPVSVDIHAKSVSLDAQNTYISNNFRRNNNHIDSRNISGVNSVNGNGRMSQGAARNSRITR